MRLAEVNLRDAGTWPDAAVWLCWNGETPVGAIAREGMHRTISLQGLPLLRAPPPVSVVICTRDRPESLQRCLAALGEQRSRAAEILVVDNASRDGRTRRCAARHGAGYVREPRPGVRFARNRGLMEARGEVVAYLDDDCIPVRGWLAALRHAFAAEPQAGCCTGPLVAQECVTEAQRLMERRGGFCKGFERRVFGPGSHQRQWRHYPLQSWMFGSGGNMAFRRDALLAAGGFAPDLPQAEDLDAFFRILRDGHTLVYEPCATVFHDHVRGRTALRRRLYGWGYGYTAYLSRVVRNEPEYRRRALREIAGFLGYQLRDRWWPALRGRGDLPRDLVTAEFLGALAGIPGYWRDRFLAARGRGLTAEDAGHAEG